MNYHLSAGKFRCQESLVPLRVLRCNEHSMNPHWGVCTKDRVEKLTWKGYNLYLHTKPMLGASVTQKHPMNMNFIMLRLNKKMELWNLEVIYVHKINSREIGAKTRKHGILDCPMVEFQI